MKVNRQNLTEEYATTAGWVRDFSDNLTKNADYLSNLRSIMKKRKDFDTIEEKMADMKSRVGFDLLKSIDDTSSQTVKEAGCGCNKCDSCSIESGHQDKDISDLRAIIRYIRDFARDRPEVGYPTVLTHCREHPTLGFDKIQKKLNFEKFKELVLNILSEHKKDPEAVIYESEAVFDTNEDDAADYYTHAIG